MHHLPPVLSRTSSAASFDSDDITPSAINASRRTRKRFTNTQLTMLENLFHQTSHPSREEREAVAKAGQMEIKSVTIWFQNKRQTERKSQASKESTNSRTVSPTFSNSTVSSTKSGSSSSLAGARPSLDRIATRTEMRNHHHPPKTPRRHTQSSVSASGPIWDHMPSSPLVPPSPAASDYIDFTKNARSKRTLEWACAAARISEKEHHLQQQKHHLHHPHALSSYSYSPAAASSSASAVGKRTVHREKPQANYHPDVTPKGAPMDLDDTDEEDDDEEEAITPPSTLDRHDPLWHSHSIGSSTRKPFPNGVDDDDMMKAALALCGLGGRRTL